MIKKLWLGLGIFFSVYALDHQKEFIKSFVMHYDFSPEGRYTHEYHPFLLAQTRSSIAQLEAFLIDQKFDVQDRILIMGYQQEGVPSYYSNLNAHPIDDEISLKTKKGRVVPAHNIFGFLTGFLLKDCNWLQKKWFPSEPLLIEHIQPERVDLFDDKAYLLQKHAFGEDFNGILLGRDALEKTLKQRDLKATLSKLIMFWECAYKGELKSSGQEVLATQDILFSVDYAKHLTQTKIPLKKMYVGPDITYPIEVLPFQEQAATESAQYFVEYFSDTLRPRDNKKTAYIFCSFVDGVGKSTLLGNVINYAKHGNDVPAYERVDNSSSQRGTLYELRENTYIMDLPAQLSHWVSKPDGYVFVDSATVKDLSNIEKNALKKHVFEHQKQYREAFKKALERSDLSDDYYDVYVKNARLFNSEERWVPFDYQGRTYLFNEDNPTAIKILVPLEGVHSRGLKTVHPDHMLFTKGLLLPMKYDCFMEDIAAQFRKAGIEKLVFVDFLSMYPRSSRENVRINFLMQQLKELFPNQFSVDKSLYRSFINGAPEMYHFIKKYQKDFTQSLLLETAVRTALYNLFKEHSSSDIVSLSEREVTLALKKEMTTVLKEHAMQLSSLVPQKVEQECAALSKYARDKKYDVFVAFDFAPLVAFSEYMTNLFGYSMQNHYLQGLWQGCADGVGMQTLETFDTACRDSVRLGPWFVALRAQWYATLCNLVFAEQDQQGNFLLEKGQYHSVPLVISQHNKQLYIQQKQLFPVNEKPDYSPSTLSRFHNYGYCKDLEWGLFNDIPHCLQWQGSETYWGIYAFGSTYSYNNYVRKQVLAHQNQAKLDGFDNVALYSSELCSMIEQDKAWGSVVQKELVADKEKLVTYGSAQWYAIRTWVRAIATLEMILKDPQAWVITRKGSREDFAATLELLERITLPKYFGVKLDKPLFDDYLAVDPVISWDLIDE